MLEMFQRISICRRNCRETSYFYAILWTVLVTYFSLVGNAYADNTGIKHYSESHALKDGPHDLMELMLEKDPNRYLSPTLPDTILAFLAIYTIIILLFIHKLEPFLIIFKRWLIVYNTVFTIRCLEMPLTVLPLPRNIQMPYTCIKKWDNIFLAPFIGLIEGRMNCYDLVFSGHTSNGLILCLILYKYSQFSTKYGTNPNLIRSFEIYNNTIHFKLYNIFRLIFCKLIPTISFLFIAFFLLYFKIHYTIDVTTACVLSYMIFHFIDYQITLETGFFKYWEDKDEYEISVSAHITPDNSASSIKSKSSHIKLN